MRKQQFFKLVRKQGSVSITQAVCDQGYRWGAQVLDTKFWQLCVYKRHVLPPQQEGYSLRNWCEREME